MCGCCFHGDKSDLDKDANKWHDKRKEMRFTSAQGGPFLLALTSEITHAVDSKRNKQITDDPANCARRLPNTVRLTMFSRFPAGKVVYSQM